MRYIVYIAIGGSLGAVFRYTGSKMVMQLTNSTFPLGTLFVNALGSFLMGIAYVIINRYTISSDFNSMITIGLLGAFTTMSTYCLETVNLFRDGEYKFMIINILMNNVVTILAVLMGLYVSRIILNMMSR